MSGEEEGLVLDCRGEHLVGILHPAAADASLGVLVVVGGPQYRVGSHRQFVAMARALAAAGIPVMRFDSRGMGDSGGERISFAAVSADIDAAVGVMRSRLPGIERVVLLGLCDGASAALINGYQRADVSGMILLNPWVRDDAAGGRRSLRDYYRARLRQGGLWRKITARRLRLFRSMGGVFRALADSGRQRSRALGGRRPSEPVFVGRMRSGLAAFGRPVLLLVSGDDLTGREFLELCRADARWRAAAEGARIQTSIVVGADHTMSSRAHLDVAVRQCIDWLQEEFDAGSRVT